MVPNLKILCIEEVSKRLQYYNKLHIPAELRSHVMERYIRRTMVNCMGMFLRPPLNIVHITKIERMIKGIVDNVEEFESGYDNFMYDKGSMYVMKYKDFIMRMDIIDQYDPLFTILYKDLSLEIIEGRDLMYRFKGNRELVDMVRNLK